MSRWLSHLGAVIALTLLAAPTQAGLVAVYDIGDGSSTSSVQIEFSNYSSYIFNVSYEDDGNMTGWSLLEIIAVQMPSSVTLQFETYSWGHWLQGITVDSDSDFGTGAGWPDLDDYWAYWTGGVGPLPSWDYATTGADDRLVSDGSWDAWTFHPLGAAPPLPIPAPGVGGAILLLAWGPTRKRR